MILRKYYNKEIINIFISIMLFIISIVSANLLIKLFQQAYSKGLEIKSIIIFIILSIPESIILITPISIFLAIIISFGKFFANNEMIITLGSGISWMQIITFILKPICILTIIVLLNVMYISPVTKQIIDTYKESLSAKNFILSISDKKIIKAPNGEIIYIEKRIKNTLYNIFLYKNLIKNKQYIIIISPKAQIIIKKMVIYIILNNVKIYTKSINNVEYSYNNAKKIIYTIFNKYNYNHKNLKLDRLCMHTIIKNFYHNKNGHLYKAEFIKRINNTFTVIVSSLLALSLCQLKPKQNQYSKLIPSIIILAVYLCNNIFINILISSNAISLLIGFCLAHLFFIIFAILIIKKK